MPIVSKYEPLRDKEQLEHLYHEKGLTQEKIADLIGCADSTVCRHMEGHGIETRSRGARSGDKHPRWNGGNLKNRGWNWQRQRKKALKRDNYECQECGMDNESHKDIHGHALHVHHIEPWSTFDSAEKANRLENLVTLCRECHIYGE